jgi:FkbM family methyltransferase
MSLKRYGTTYGGFYYPEKLEGLNESSIIYCVGAGEDISHDIMLASQLNTKVYIFDPTPRAIDHVNHVISVINGEQEPSMSSRIGGGAPEIYWEYIKKYNINEANGGNLILHPYGIFTCNDVLNFYSPSNEEFVSHSLIREMKSDKCTIKVPVKRLDTVMAELGHSSIDLLKLDVEGCECDVINQMIGGNILPKYLSIDFDLGWHGERLKDANKCVNTINNLKAAGYNILFNSESNYSFTLL